eukprot:scaffold12226_cov129-Isochrysis_galbana.AAC.3
MAPLGIAAISVAGVLWCIVALLAVFILFEFCRGHHELAPTQMTSPAPSTGGAGAAHAPIQFFHRHRRHVHAEAPCAPGTGESHAGHTACRPSPDSRPCRQACRSEESTGGGAGRYLEEVGGAERSAVRGRDLQGVGGRRGVADLAGDATEIDRADCVEIRGDISSHMPAAPGEGLLLTACDEPPPASPPQPLWGTWQQGLGDKLWPQNTPADETGGKRSRRRDVSSCTPDEEAEARAGEAGGEASGASHHHQPPDLEADYFEESGRSEGDFLGSLDRRTRPHGIPDRDSPPPGILDSDWSSLGILDHDTPTAGVLDRHCPPPGTGHHTPPPGIVAPSPRPWCGTGTSEWGYEAGYDSAILGASGYGSAPAISGTTGREPAIVGTGGHGTAISCRGSGELCRGNAGARASRASSVSSAASWEGTYDAPPPAVTERAVTVTQVAVSGWAVTQQGAVTERAATQVVGTEAAGPEAAVTDRTAVPRHCSEAAFSPANLPPFAGPPHRTTHQPGAILRPGVSSDSDDTPALAAHAHLVYATTAAARVSQGGAGIDPPPTSLGRGPCTPQPQPPAGGEDPATGAFRLRLPELAPGSALSPIRSGRSAGTGSPRSPPPGGSVWAAGGGGLPEVKPLSPRSRQLHAHITHL